MTIVTRLLLIFLTISLSGCAAAVSKQDFLALENRVRAQEEKTASASDDIRPQMAEFQAEMNDMRVQLNTLEGRLGELERQVNMTKGTTDEVRRLGREVQSLHFAWQQAAARLGLDMDELFPEQPEEELVPEVVDETDKVVQLKPETTQKPAAPKPAETDPAKALYEEALEMFKQRKYEAAQAAWKEFTDNFPKNPLAANALFWQGECFYQMKDFARAILAYQEVIGKYPKSAKYPSALLKQGISFIKIGKKDAGHLLLKDVIKKFPDTAEAKRAKKVLGE